MTSDLPFRVLLNWAVEYVAEDIRVRRYSESDCFALETKLKATLDREGEQP